MTSQMRKTSPKENWVLGGKVPYCSSLTVSCNEQMCVSGRAQEKKLKEIAKKNQNNNSYFRVLPFSPAPFSKAFAP